MSSSSINPMVVIHLFAALKEPALKELVGEQNWKEMQERSDDNRVLKELSDAVENVVSSSRQSHTGSPLT